MISSVRLQDRDRQVMCIVYDDFAAKTAALLEQHEWIARAIIEMKDGTEETDRAQVMERLLEYR